MYITVPLLGLACEVKDKAVIVKAIKVFPASQRAGFATTLYSMEYIAGLCPSGAALLIYLVLPLLHVLYLGGNTNPTLQQLLSTVRGLIVP
jgi:hypothetical protein